MTEAISWGREDELNRQRRVFCPSRAFARSGKRSKCEGLGQRGGRDGFRSVARFAMQAFRRKVTQETVQVAVTGSTRVPQETGILCVTRERYVSTVRQTVARGRTTNGALQITSAGCRVHSYVPHLRVSTKSIELSCYKYTQTRTHNIPVEITTGGNAADSRGARTRGASRATSCEEHRERGGRLV